MKEKRKEKENSKKKNEPNIHFMSVIFQPPISPKLLKIGVIYFAINMVYVFSVCYMSYRNTSKLCIKGK